MSSRDWYAITSAHLLIGPDTAGAVAVGLRASIDEQRRNGLPPPADWSELLDALRSVASERGPVAAFPHGEAEVAPMAEMGARSPLARNG
jgi:hypothetical protein